MTGVLAGKVVTRVAAATSRSLVLCADGTVAAWGGNYYGQLGNGSRGWPGLPVAVDPLGVLAEKQVTAIAAGSYFSLVRCADGTLAAWGHNSDLVLGNGSFNSSSLPVPVNAGGLASGERFSAQFSGHYATHNLALVAMPFIPRIAVESPAGSPVAKCGATVDFGAVAVGNVITRGFVQTTATGRLGTPSPSLASRRISRRAGAQRSRAEALATSAFPAGHGGCKPPPRAVWERQAPAWRVAGVALFLCLAVLRLSGDCG